MQRQTIAQTRKHKPDQKPHMQARDGKQMGKVRGPQNLKRGLRQPAAIPGRYRRCKRPGLPRQLRADHLG